jgi:hypothetical protein
MTRTLCVLAIAALLAGGCTERQSAPPPAGAPAGSESAAGGAPDTGAPDAGADAPAVDALLDQVDEQLADDAQPTEEDD